MPYPHAMPGVDFRSLPKLELHCHLDTGVRPETVADIGRELGLPLPDRLAEALVAPEGSRDLADVLSRVALEVGVMQRPQDIRRVAHELVEDLARDGVFYAEVRFAPQLHTRLGLTLQQVLEAARAGLAEGAERWGVELGLILCCLRHQTAAESLAVAQLAAANRGSVCALDLAGDEGSHPSAATHAPAFTLARSAGLHATVHAGENGGPERVLEALDVLGAQRIGHGVRVEGDGALLARLQAEAVPLDMCPRSNVLTQAVPRLADHPIDRLLRRGLRVTVSTDGRTLIGTTLTAEFERLAEQFGWGLAEFAQCQRNAARAAFVPEPARERLLERLRGLPPAAGARPARGAQGGA